MTIRLGLTLGGGGARGSAHLGFLKEMQRFGVWPPSIITGTSIGGVVGAMIAAGVDLDSIATFFRQFTLGQIYTLPGNKPAITDNTKAEAMLVAMLGRPTFADLKIPLAVVTADLVERKEVVLDDGDLVSALLATAAFPVLTPPVIRNGLTLIDGGVLNNVPFDVARARGATYVVAIDLSNTAPYGTSSETASPGSGMIGRALFAAQRHPVLQVIASVTDIITVRGVRARLAISPPDLLVRPELGTIGLLDFYRVDEGISAGIKAAEQVESTLLQLAGQMKS